MTTLLSELLQNKGRTVQTKNVLNGTVIGLVKAVGNPHCMYSIDIDQTNDNKSVNR